MASKSRFIPRNPPRRLISSVIFIAIAVLMGISDAWAKGTALAAGAMPAQVTEETGNQPSSSSGQGTT